MTKTTNIQIEDTASKTPYLGSLLAKGVKEKNKKITTPPLDALSNISKGTIKRQEVLEDITSLFPDMELAIQILVSSIMSPKDMMSEELQYSVDKINLPYDLVNKLLSHVKENINTIYDIGSQLPEIIRNVLFEKGSHVVCIIPENVLDRLLANKEVTTESVLERKYHISSNKGILSNTETVDEYLEISDNLDQLKLPKFYEIEREVTVESIITGTRTRRAGMSWLYNADIANKDKTMITMPTTGERESIGRPMVLNLPSEAVIPVQSPGRLDKKLGIFVLLDNTGNPITRKHTEEFSDKKFSEVFNTQLGGEVETSRIIKKAKKALNINKKGTKNMPEVLSFYKDLVEKELVEKLKNGVYKKEEIEISNKDEVYKLLLFRHMSKMKTKILYIPQEVMVYYAYKYYPNGVGKSLTDDLLVISSIRAMTLFAKLMAMVKNTIPTTKVQVELDETDPDPDKTIETIVSYILGSQRTYLPVGSTNISDLANWASQLGYEFEFSGHPRIPTTNINYESTKINHELPDDELDENLRKRSFMALGLPAEVVDNGFSGDFATTVVANNILLSKRISMYQKVFNRFITDHVRKLVRYDEIIKDNLREIVKDNLPSIKKQLPPEHRKNLDNPVAINTITEAFIDNIIIKLPSPETTTLQNLTEQYNEYKSALDEAVEALLKEELLDSQVVGDIGDKLPVIIEVYKAYFLRKWMADNNYLPELFDIINTDGEGKPVIPLSEITSEHSTKLMNSIYDYLKNINPVKKKLEKKLDRLEEGEEGEEEPAAGGDTGGAEEEPEF